MKRASLLFLLFFLPGLFCLAGTNHSTEPPTITVPLGGNSWVSEKSKARIRSNGLTNWAAESDIITIYFRAETTGTADLSLKLSVPEGKSQISLTAQGKTFTKEVSNLGYSVVHIGNIEITDTGYVKIALKGLSKTGVVFAEVSDLIVSGTALEKGAAYVKNNEGNYFLWGRRGPSVHLNYQIPKEATEVAWFYNEVTVPASDDKLGTYYMANGFSGGYFGMQNNSPTERRVLFSIWSPFNTDDPKSIPDSMKVILLKKGAITRTGEFGNEGAGGQSYIVYPWKADKTYAFLIGTKPNVAKRSTVFTAYFKDLEKGTWQLIASFERPQQASHLKGLNSFLECFSPVTGDQTRQAHYKNQWVIDAKGQWHEITGAIFTADNTARMGYRKDYSGGTDGKSFYLRNCGFFDDFTPIKTAFERKPTGKPHPAIDFDKLP